MAIFEKLRQLRDLSRRPARRIAAPDRFRPALESLEDRTVPTVVYTPYFGQETLIQTTGGDYNYATISGASVDLIFWGTYWRTHDTEAKSLLSEAQTILRSPYFSGLTEYGSDGRAAFHNSYIDKNGDPSRSYSAQNNTSSGELQGEIVNVINSRLSTIAPPPSGSMVTNAPIYVVIVDPSHSDTNGGYNHMGEYNEIPINMISIGTQSSTGSPNVDSFGTTFSHEMVERMSDPTDDRYGNYGVRLNPPAGEPANINTGNNSQIADNEAESYSYRLGGPGGVDVQPYWSDMNPTRFPTAFIVPDGNSQRVTLSPIWTVSGSPPVGTFSGQYDLTVDGDQFGAGTQDSISVDTDAAGDVSVNLNGEIFYFDSGQLNSITVNTGGGINDVSIPHTSKSVPVTVVGGLGSTDTVTLGNSINGVQGIQGDVTVTNPPSRTRLVIDDSTDSIARTVTVTDGSVVGLAPATINYIGGDLSSLNITTSTGIDDVRVRSTSALITNLYSAGGDDIVTVGSGHSVQGVRGTLSIDNRFGFSPVLVDDSADTVGRSVTMGTFTPAHGNDFGFIHGLAPADINYRYTGTRAVTVDAGSGPNVVNVLSAGVATTVVGGKRGTTFSVGSASQDLGNLFDNLTLQTPFHTNNSLYVYDKDVGRHTYTVSHGELDRATELHLPNGGILVISHHLILNNVNLLEVDGTDGGNSYEIDDVEPRFGLNSMQIVLNTGAGNDDVHVNNTTDVLTINGQGGGDNVTVGSATAGTTGLSDSVHITNAAGVTSLYIDDRADTQARFVSMSGATGTGTINGFTPIKSGPFGRTAISFAVQDILEINILAGSGANSFSFFDIPVFTTLATGTGANTVQVFGTEDRLFVNSQGALNRIVVGGTQAQKGSLDRVAGTVSLAGVARSLDIRDGSASTQYTYTMDAQQFVRADASGVWRGQIDYSGLSLTNLNVLLGNGGNSVLINGTPTLSGTPSAAITVSTGTGNDAVTVFGSGAPLALDLGSGRFQSVTIGDPTHSLDAIRGPVSVTGGGIFSTLDVTVSNEASTTAQVASIGVTPSGRGQTLLRQQFNGDHYDMLNSFTFNYGGRGRLVYHDGQGGDTTFVVGTPANSTTSLYGGTGYDGFWVETDNPASLGAVNVYADPTIGEYSYYYDYLNPASLTYTVAQIANPGGPDIEQVKRSGAAPVTFYGLQQIIFYTAHVGGNTVSVQSLPQRMFLNMVNGPGDTVTLGRPVAGGGRTLADILGAVSVQGTGAINVTLDDSADTVGRNAVLHPKTTANGDYITGLPGELLMQLDDTASVAILGGKGDDHFSVNGTVFAPSIRFDGGPGNNTLDYSGAPQGVRVNLAAGTASGLKGGVANVQNAIGSAFNDILIGDGLPAGSVLTGGAGRDILIAGTTPGTLTGGDGEDLLIAGYTDYDTDPAMLEAVMAVWVGTDTSFDTRVSDLESGLLAGKVHSNGGPNFLYGQGDQDAFFVRLDSNDQTDWTEGEALIRI